MLRFKSILSRIISLHIIAIAATTILMPLALYGLLVSEVDQIHQRSMREQADRLTLFLSVNQDGQWNLALPADLKDVYSSAYGRYLYSVVDENGRLLFSSSDPPSAIFPNGVRSQQPSFLQTERDGSPIAGASIPKSIAGRTVWIEVGEDLAHRDVIIDDVVAGFFFRVAWITLPLLLMLLFIDIIIVRRALKPVFEASEQAKQIGPQRPDVRLPSDRIPTELRSLVLAVNQALDRLEDGFRVQREFAADAAHELRTPLAILRTRVDTLADQSVSKMLRYDLEAMSRIVSQLLDMAEVDTQFVGSTQRADLRSVAADVVEFIAPLAVQSGKNIALIADDDPVWVAGDPEMLSRAIRNLAENAIKHTPPQSCVEIVVEKEMIVRIRDEGPGIDNDQLGLLFKRFWRGDRRATGSAGLGLSIVQRIVEIHGAVVKAENRPGNGAEFSITFPHR